MYATRSSQIGLALRTDSSALPQACTLIGAAAMPEIDGNRKHPMRAVPTGACQSAPDVRQGALGGRRARLDVVTSGSGSGRAFPARPKNTEIVQPFLMHPIPLRSEMFFFEIIAR